MLLISTVLYGLSLNEEPIEYEKFKLSEALIGGAIGAVIGVLGTWISSYIGPRAFEKWKTKQIEKKHDEPRKRLLLQMLNDENFKDGRKLSTLCMVTGTKKEECRRLLIQLDARGIKFSNVASEDSEGWVLIQNKPLTER